MSRYFVGLLHQNAAKQPSGDATGRRAAQHPFIVGANVSMWPMQLLTRTPWEWPV